jgi:hypothetical protein
VRGPPRIRSPPAPLCALSSAQSEMPASATGTPMPATGRVKGAHRPPASLSDTVAVMVPL